MTDLSGDYTEYPDVRTISDITSDYASKETKISAEIRGSGSRYSVAVWTISKGNGVISSYAVTVSGSGFTEDEMRELIAEIIGHKAHNHHDQWCLRIIINDRQ